MKEEIQNLIQGEVKDDAETLAKYSKDASLFELRPQLVVFPKDSEDLQSLVRFVRENKQSNPELSLTIRAAGSCMSGGSLNDSIVADVTKHMNHLGEVSQTKDTDACITTEPGVFYRDFEGKTLASNVIFPAYPASKNLAALGGMIANNCAGEKSLRWGKIENFVLETKVILSDGNEYTVKPLNQTELTQKIAENTFEGNLYKRIYNLLENNKQLIQEAKPQVSKNSAGYFLWNICPSTSLGVKNDDFVFDLNKLLVGSQGTLGIITEAKIRLVPVEPVSKLFVIFLKDLKPIAELVNLILPTNPESIESYDDDTLKLAFRFFPEMLKSMRVKHFLKLMLSFIPEAFMMLKGGGLPKLVMLVEYTGQTSEEVDAKLERLNGILESRKLNSRKTRSEEESSKYWTIRRESFNLLRQHVKGKRTAPFVDDVVVRPEDMPEFLPKMRAILDEYKLDYTIAGHAGNGNFHIIPLMNMKNHDNVRVIKEVGNRVYDLVAEYEGSITGEHNDGLVRTPYLGKMYKPEVLELFKQTKEIFDPQNIFNPGKKVPEGDPRQGGARKGSEEYMLNHIAKG